MALDIPAGYGERIRDGQPTTVQVVADGTRCEFDERRARSRRHPGGLLCARADVIIRQPPTPLVSADVRVWFNPELESKDFMIPGILALLLLVVTTNLSSMSIVREKELGKLEQLNATPIARWELIVGKMLPHRLYWHHRRADGRARRAAVV